MLVFAIGTKFKHPQYDCYISVTKHLGGDSCEVEWSGKEKDKHRNSKKMTTASLVKSFLLVTPTAGITNIIEPFQTKPAVVSPTPAPVEHKPAPKPVDKAQLASFKMEARVVPPETNKIVIRSGVATPPKHFMNDMEINEAIKQMIDGFSKEGDLCNFLFKIEHDYYRKLEKDEDLGFGDHLSSCGFDDDAVDLYKDYRYAKTSKNIIKTDQYRREFNKLYGRK